MATSGLIDVNLLGYYNSKLQNEFTTNELEANRARIKIAEVTGSLTAASASFSNMGLSRLTVTGKAIVQNLDVNNAITSDSIQSNTVNGNYISANNSITTPFLEATSISATQISAGDKIQAPIGEFESLKVDHIEADSLGTEYLKADGANITEAIIKKLFVDTGIFEEAIIKDGYVTGYLDAVHIRADSIVANKISLLGPDGLYYALNTEGATEGQTLENALDGSHIIAESITASKIRVSDLVAFGATIGGWTIDDTALRSRLKQAYDDAIPGVYFGSGLTKVEDYLTDESGNRLTDEYGNDLYLLKTKQTVKYLSDGNGNYITDENDNLIGVYVDDESAYTFGFLCDDTDSSPSRLLLSSEGIDIRTPNFVVNRDTGAVFVNGSITIAETGEQLTTALNNARKVATNYMSFESNYGLMIADMTDGVILPSEVTSTDDFRNVLIDSDSVDIRVGSNVLATFGEDTIIGRTDVAGQRYIKLTSSSMGIYKTVANAYADDIDFLVQGATNEDDHETAIIAYSSSAPFILDFENGIDAGYTGCTVTCTHPDGVSSWSETYDFTTLEASGASGSFTPSTGDTYSIDWLGNSADVYITLGSATSALDDIEFAFDIRYTGGETTALYLGGDDEAANLAVLSTGKIYSQYRQINMEYGLSDTFTYGGNSTYWIVGGYITSSRTAIWFSLTLPRNLPYAGRNCTVQVQSLKLAIRSQNTSGAGGYVGTTSSKASENGQQFVGLSGITINTYVANANTVTIQIKKSSDFAISTGTLANNVPVSIRVISTSLRFIIE